MSKGFVVGCDNCGVDCSDAYYNDGNGNTFCNLKCKEIFAKEVLSE